MESRMTPKSAEEVARTLQIILVALAAGTIVFGGIVLYLGKDQPPGQPIMTYLAIGFSVVDGIMSFVVPLNMVSQARTRVAAQLSQDDLHPTAGEQDRF